MIFFHLLNCCLLKFWYRRSSGYSISRPVSSFFRVLEFQFEPHIGGRGQSLVICVCLFLSRFQLAYCLSVIFLFLIWCSLKFRYQRSFGHCISRPDSLFFHTLQFKFEHDIRGGGPSSVTRVCSFFIRFQLANCLSVYFLFLIWCQFKFPFQRSSSRFVSRPVSSLFCTLQFKFKPTLGEVDQVWSLVFVHFFLNCNQHTVSLFFFSS